jgi:hypothetical protein
MTKKDKSIVLRDKGDSVLLEIEASSVEAQETFRISLQAISDTSRQPNLQPKSRTRLGVRDSREDPLR